MTYYVTKNSETKFGYSIKDDTGKIYDLTRKTTDGYLYLPDDVKNSTNRNLIGIKLLEKYFNDHDDDLELTVRDYHEPRKLDKQSSKKVDWTQFLTEDEKQQLEKLKEICMKRYESTLPSPKEREKQKLQEMIEKLTKKLTDLDKESE